MLYLWDLISDFSTAMNHSMLDIGDVEEKDGRQGGREGGKQATAI
jgi:hypothetical protein